MQPSQKTAEMSALLNALSVRVFGREREESIQNNVCVTCGATATYFKDALSRKEFSISGMCQVCQDGVFGPPEDQAA